LTSGRTHHELLLNQDGDAPGPLTKRRRGLSHIGVKVGDSLDDLRAAEREYPRDQDNSQVYVDADEALWKNNPAAVVSPIKPLEGRGDEEPVWEERAEEPARPPRPPLPVGSGGSRTRARRRSRRSR